MNFNEGVEEIISLPILQYLGPRLVDVIKKKYECIMGNILIDITKRSNKNNSNNNNNNNDSEHRKFNIILINISIKNKQQKKGLHL